MFCGIQLYDVVLRQGRVQQRQDSTEVRRVAEQTVAVVDQICAFLGQVFLIALPGQPGFCELVGDRLAESVVRPELID